MTFSAVLVSLPSSYLWELMSRSSVLHICEVVILLS